MRSLSEDCRGVVYVEFLIAFVPLFVLFLATCQMALLSTARIVVRHAAFAAVRSAVVVLEDSPEDYDDAPRGSLSAGKGSTRLTMQAVLTGLASRSDGFAAPSLSSSSGSGHGSQSGARMALIRAAAYAPLLSLAPREGELEVPQRGSIGHSLPAGVESRLAFAVDYTQAASAVTIQAARGDDALATDPVESKGEVTVRVTYLYPCSVPVVRALMCRSLESLLGTVQHRSALGIAFTSGGTPLRSRLDLAEAPGELERKSAGDARFLAIAAEASLPNQGADYYSRKGG